MSIVRSFAAVLSEITRRPAATGFARSPMRATIRGRRRTPPLAIAAYADASCIGVTDSPWPIGRLPIDGPGVLVARQDEARLLARQLDLRGPAEAEAPHPVVEAVGAEPLADLDRPDVRGLREDLRGREVDRPARVGLLDDAVGDLDRRRQVPVLVRA